MSQALHGTLTAEDALAARRSLQRQDCLRKQIEASLAQYPASYLYDDELEGLEGCPEEVQLAQLQGFQALLRHIRRTLQTSPRNESLKALTRKFQAAAEPPSPMAELYEVLGLRRDTAALAVAEAVESVKPSRRYVQWQAACEAGKKVGKPEGHEEAIREGLRRKARSQGLPAPSEEELSEQLIKIERSREDRSAEHRERAARLWSELGTDPEHLTWQRVRSLWKESGGEELLAQYQVVDRAQGDDRRLHGSHFEVTDARHAAALAVELLQLRADLFLPGKGKGSSADGEACEFKFLQGCTWYDSKMRVCGEVDVVVLASSPGQEAWCGLVVAIIEMKSGWFELPAALLLQHAAKLSCAQLGEASLRWSSHRLLLGEPGVFVATLIPPHPFVIGLDPELLRAISKKLFPGNSETPVEEDLNGCKQLHDSLRNDTHLRARLSMSPSALLRHPELKHRILVLGSHSCAASDSAVFSSVMWFLLSISPGKTTTH